MFEKKEFARRYNMEVKHVIRKSQFDEMQRNFLAVIPDKLECKLQEEIEKTYEGQKTLKKFSDRVELLEKEDKSVNKGINLFYDIFHKTPTANKTLLDVKDQIKELNKIWGI
jgi:glycerophosphoryl diester phosphodiesterase